MIIPMPARLVPAAFNREGWLFEVKWDGFRAVAETSAKGTKLYSRKHTDFTKRFPTITQALNELKTPCILDGEIVALDDTGRPHFEWLINKGPQQGILVYYVFDLLKVNKWDVRKEPLRTRKEHLQTLLNGNPRLIFVEHIETHGLAMLEGATLIGLEGIVAKNSESPYIEGPTKTWHWQKIKNPAYERPGKIEFHNKPRKR